MFVVRLTQFPLSYLFQVAVTEIDESSLLFFFFVFLTSKSDLLLSQSADLADLYGLGCVKFSVLLIID